MKSGRAILSFVAVLLTVAASISTAVTASPPTPTAPAAPAADGVIDLGNDLALPPGARIGSLASAPGDGFTELVGEDNGGQYTFRLLTSPGIEAYRPVVEEVAAQLNAINGPYFTVAGGLGPAPSDPVNPPEPRRHEIHILVSATSPCGSGSWVGCGGPRQYATLGGVPTWTAGVVWLRTSLGGYSSVVQEEVVLHEIGHALGLGHFDDEWEGNFQVMRSFVDVGITETGYRSGDINGLEYKAPPPPVNDRRSAATPLALSAASRDAATWFATATGGAGEPELRSKFAPASNRSVWFRFQARPEDVGRELVVETINDGVEDFDTLLGRVVDGALVGWNDNFAGASTSHLEFTPADTATVHYFVVDGKSRGRGVTQISIRPRGDGFVALSPRRIVDSRRGLGGFRTKWGPGTERTVRAAGITGVPSSATAVVLDVSAVAATAYSALTVYTDGQARPLANVATRAGKLTTSQVVVAVGANDRVRIHNAAGRTHVLVDVVGYFTAGGGVGFEPVVPRRVLDSRNGNGGFRTPWGRNVARQVLIAGRGGVPATATAVVLNMAAVGARAAGSATVWPAGARRPATTALSWSTGETTSKQVTVRLGAGGRIAVFTATNRPIHLTADVVGWYSPTARTRYVAVRPVRTFDTRTGLGVDYAYPLLASQTRRVSLAAAKIPGGARAITANVRMDGLYGAGSTTIWDGAGRRPATLSTTWVANVPISHSVTTRIREGGISIYAAENTTEGFADVVGYYAP